MGLPDEQMRACLDPLIHTCYRILRHALAAARLAGALLPRVDGGDLAEPARTIRMGRADLASDPGYHEAVETPRWGRWASEERLARLFHDLHGVPSAPDSRAQIRAILDRLVATN